jgi:hypothetical protein
MNLQYFMLNVITIVIVKISNSDEIVGGYNPLQWKSVKSCKSTKDNFIYYLKIGRI